MKLSSLAEGDESPDNALQNVSTPQPSKAVCAGATGPKELSEADLPAFKTPPTVSRIRPGLDEMHPSKVHKSTTKPIGPASQPPADSMALAVRQITPTNLPGAWPRMVSPRFDFTIGNDESLLSAEAQRIMDSVRGEAAKIKAQIQAERDMQQEDDDEEVNLVWGRGIAQPKGRYSDVHREEFKKMDSIAGHASIWKNKIQSNAAMPSNRSDSNLSTGAVESQLPPPASLKSLKASRSQDSDRIENTASGKRARKCYGDDTSTARPKLQDEPAQNETMQPTALKKLPPSRLPSAIMTPTKASLARAASVKSLKYSLIPSPSRSNLAQTTGSPVMIKSEGSKKYRRSLAKLGHMKSLFNRHQLDIANDPNKHLARPALATPRVKIQLDSALPNLPQPGQARFLYSPTVADPVKLTPVAKTGMEDMPASPSPLKFPEARSVHKLDASASKPINYPSISNSPNITTRVKIPIKIPAETLTGPVPGDFTFRSDQTLLFSSRPQTPTIRRVRPSGISTPVSTFTPLPPIPHGLPNKKRRRADSDDEDIENVVPVGGAMGDDDNDDDADEPRAKKLKSSPLKKAEAGAGAITTGSKIPQAQKRNGSKEKSKGKGRGGVLSLSRLNVLARPKARH